MSAVCQNRVDVQRDYEYAIAMTLGVKSLSHQ